MKKYKPCNKISCIIDIYQWQCKATWLGARVAGQKEIEIILRGKKHTTPYCLLFALRMTHNPEINIENELHIPDICQFFYTGKFFWE